MRAGKASHSHSPWALVVEWVARGSLAFETAVISSLRRRPSSHVVGGRSGLPFREGQVDGIRWLGQLRGRLGPQNFWLLMLLLAGVSF